MWKRCICFQKKKPRLSKTKEELDHELDVYMSVKNVSCVTGRPISPIKTDRKIPVSIDTNRSYLMDLVERGWRTNGETIQLNDRTYVWYTLEEEKQKIPLTSDEDVRSEYEWKRVLIESELGEYQAKKWMTRAYCSKTNRIWICRRKE